MRSLLIIFLIVIAITTWFGYNYDHVYAKLDHATFEKCFHNPRIINQIVANALDDVTKLHLEREAVEYNSTIPNPNNTIDFHVHQLVTKIHVCMVEGGH